jgi:uncharacterized repeat protein (TIGR01451 family)
MRPHADAFPIRSVCALLGLVALSMAAVVPTAPPSLASGVPVGFTVNMTTDGKDAKLGNGKCDTDLGSTGNQCTLRAAVMEADWWGTKINIAISSGTYTLTIAGAGEDRATKGDLDLRGDITINGTIKRDVIIKAGSGFDDRIFDIPAGISPDVSFFGATIQGGSARRKESGGGIRALGKGALSISHTTISANSAGGSGGGLYASNGSVITTGPITVVGNSAGANGGGIDLEGNAKATLSHLTVIGNRAKNGGGMSAFVASGATGTAEFSADSTVDGNTATVAGGGLDIGRTFLENLIVSHNHASVGGGIQVVAAGKPSTIAGRNDIFGNTASARGGGLNATACGRSCGRVYNTNIHDNAAKDGAGVYATGALTLTNMSVYLNTATGKTYGGGLFHAGRAGHPLRMTNVTVDSNRNSVGSSLSSGVIIASNTADPMTNMTITKNVGGKAKGIAVLGSAAAPSVKNSIVASSGRNCIGAITSLGNNLDTRNTCRFNKSSDLTNADARMAPYEAHDNGGFTATVLPNPLSQAIDAGANKGCPLTDARAVQRPFEGRCDMGAVEFTSLTGNSNIKLNNLKAVPNPVAKGALETYTLTVVNAGPQPSHNTVLTNVLPQQVSFRSCSAPGVGICAHVGNVVTVTWTSLAIGQSATVTIVATVSKDTGAAKIVNSLYAYSDNPDNYPLTNIASATVRIS